MAQAQTKVTPYWHPRYVSNDNPRYSAMARKDAALVLRQNHANKTVYRQRDTHGALWYVIDTGYGYVSGRVFIPLRAIAA